MESKINLTEDEKDCLQLMNVHMEYNTAIKKF